MWAEILETLEDLNTALSEAKARGLEMTRAEAHYYTVKDKRAWELLEEGLSATAIGMVIKGEPEVSEALQHFHEMEVLYKNAVEAVNVFKLRLRVLESQYEREWSRAGMSNL